MSTWAMKRFWKDVSVTEGDSGYEVHLDDRPVRTPAKNPLALPTRALAEAVAEEWRAQEGTVQPNLMPFTRISNSALDKVAPQRDAIIALLADYGGTDLLCYRAERPEELVARQAAEWDPLLEWADAALGARLISTQGVIPIEQDAAALSALRAPMGALSDFELAAFHDLVSLSGSLVIGFAAAVRQNSAESLWEVARLDERWQIEQWGDDIEAEELNRMKKNDFLLASRVYELAGKTTHKQ